MNRADQVPYQDWQPKLGTDDIVASIDDLNQCIRLILETPIRRDSIVIQPGYAWDGCLPAWRRPGGLWLGTPDGPLGINGRPLTYHASLVHDALCQFKAEIPIYKDATVALFAELLQLAGIPPWWGWL